MARKVLYNLQRWMTPRDRQVIVSVYRHGMLNSKQVEEIHFRGNKNSRIIALRRLKKLVDNNFLKLHWYGYNNQGTMQHFTITNKGAMIVASELEIQTENIKINEAGIISNIEHTSLIADFHVSLIKNGFEVPKFTSDKLNRFEFIYNNKQQIFEPDGKGIIYSSESNRILPFFLEMDRGTMSYNYFKNKIPNYEKFYASKKYKNEFESFPLVFIVTTTENRLSRMKEIVEQTTKSDITYLFTTIEKMDSMNKGIFRVSGRNDLVSLK